MRKIALLFGTMGVVGIIVGILMSVFIDISNVWFLIPIAMNGVCIANGIKSFSLAFIGGWTLDAVTGPIGTLAGSIKKWNGVTVPESIGTQLTNLATGIKAFTGIEDISSTVSSVGKIANAMTTLTGVDFTGISGGITSFSTSITNLISATSSLSGVGDSIVNNIVNPIVNGCECCSEYIIRIIYDW